MTTAPASRAVTVLTAGLALLVVSLAPAAAEEPEPGLTPMAEALGVPFGFAIDTRETSGAAAEVLRTHATQFTAENHMKPYAWYSAPDVFSPHPDIETLMTFAVDNDLDVHGHTLVWHSQTPDWFFENAAGEPLPADDAGQEVLRERMRDHIFGVAEHLSSEFGLFGAGNPIVSFDVVNEVVSDGSSDPGGLRQSEWHRILGEDFIDLAFAYADEAFNQTYAAAGADRPVDLYINDYSTEWPDKRARLHDLVERLLERGVPVDVVGHQFHVRPFMSPQQLDDTLDDFEDLPIDQAVTEFDLPVGTPVTQQRLEDQAAYYRDAFEIFVAHRSVIAVSVWGITDDRSWLAAEGAPLMFDAAVQPKPAAFAVADLEPRVSFEDVTPESSEFFDEIMWLADRAVTTGWPTATGREFRPESEITRDAMAAFLYRYAGEPEVDTSGESPFVDVTPDSTEFYEEIVWLSEQDITLGWDSPRGQEFRPTQPITRDAMAAFLYRYAGEPDWDAPEESPFVDITEDNTEFYTEITWLADTGITKGYDSPRGLEFRPFNETTRDAMAAFLYRYDDLPV
ncbi:endo-1,4-beta-xylanase [Demequina sp. NBRC 110053]|uniref:endo-1,4-beta-xylanase n=1 Tax=Demequina sp. NBRC 110053 TaxID=1570342 RepID=UPI0009FD0FCB|nr:endo-1,4-beta-xylanase [Demequina sp. NBRC 110053]